MARGVPVLCHRHAWPPFKAGNAESGKTSLGRGKEEWDKSGLGAGGRRVGGCAGSALGFVFQILLGEGGVYALGTSCTEAFPGGDG